MNTFPKTEQNRASRLLLKALRPCLSNEAAIEPTIEEVAKECGRNVTEIRPIAETVLADLRAKATGTLKDKDIGKGNGEDHKTPQAALQKQEQTQAPEQELPPLDAYEQEFRPVVAKPALSEPGMVEKTSPDENKGERSKLPRIVFSLEDLTTEPPPPPFIIEDYFPRDVFALTGTGGTGKSTLWLIHCIHVILGRPLWDMEILAPGPVVFVTAEDGETRLKWRLYKIINQMNLSRADIQLVAKSFHVVNLVGSGRRLAELGEHGNIRTTDLADQIAEEFQTIAPVMVPFDPMVKFGPGERMFNDGEDALVNAAQRLRANLDCAAGFLHHVSKDVARNTIVDHHAGRGGSALGDGVRAAYQLVTITKNNADKFPGVELYQDDIAKGCLLAYYITKLTDAPCPSAPLILRRNGWLFEPVAMPTRKERESATEAARREHAQRDLDAVVAYLKERPFFKPSRNDIEALSADIGITRNKVRAAVTKGLKVDQALVEVPLPEDEQKGGKKTYIAVAGGAQ